jgi:Tat protein translocase TatB subunit
MELFGVGPIELLVVLALALIVLGPERLPKVARQAGRALAEFRRMSEELTRELSLQLEEETRALEAPTSSPEPEPAPEPLTPAAETPSITEAAEAPEPSSPAYLTGPVPIPMEPRPPAHRRSHRQPAQPPQPEMARRLPGFPSWLSYARGTPPRRRSMLARIGWRLQPGRVYSITQNAQATRYSDMMRRARSYSGISARDRMNFAQGHPIPGRVAIPFPNEAIEVAS